MSKIFNFNRSLLVAVTLFNLLFLNPGHGAAQYATTGMGQVNHMNNPEKAVGLAQTGYIITLYIIGILLIFLIAFFFYLGRNTAELNKPQKPLNRLTPAFLLLVLCTIGSSCSPAQRARAEQYTRTMEAQQHNCPVNHHSQPADPDFSNGYTTGGYYNGNRPAFCKWCGKRISRNH
jgi:hypothetical protein